jgi:AGZA family xanthine/uracil permease-like MFS transporter
MAYAVMIAGIAGAALGLIGVYGALVDFIGVPIQGGMMAGAGLILSIVAVELIRENWKIGGLSTVVAVVVFIATKDLIWALIASVAAGVVLGRWVPSTPVVANPEIERVRLVPRSWQDAKTFLRNPNVIRAALALLALRAGTSIAYPSITAGFAGVTPNFDHQNIIIGASGFASALFGGAPLEAIVSPTGAAPHPIGAGALFMALMGGICLLGLLPRMGRWVPVQSVCGILVVIGGLIVIPDNLPLLLDDPVPGSITMAVTAATTDPFIGMVVGILVRALLGAVGA